MKIKGIKTREAADDLGVHYMTVHRALKGLDTSIAFIRSVRDWSKGAVTPNDMIK